MISKYIPVFLVTASIFVQSNLKADFLGDLGLHKFQPSARQTFHFHSSDRSASSATSELPLSDKLYNEGNRLFRAGRFNEAAAEYRKALRLAPHDAKILHNLGCALGTMNRNEESLQEIDHAKPWEGTDFDKSSLVELRAALQHNFYCDKLDDACQLAWKADSDGDLNEALNQFKDALKWAKLAGIQQFEVTLTADIKTISNAIKENNIRGETGRGIQELRHQSAKSHVNSDNLEFVDVGAVNGRNVPSDLTMEWQKRLAQAPGGMAVRDRLRKGFQAAVLHDRALADAWFQDALNREPDNLELRKFLAAVREKNDEITPEEIIKDFENAVKMGPLDFEAHRQANLSRQKHEEAFQNAFRQSALEFYNGSDKQGQAAAAPKVSEIAQPEDMALLFPKNRAARYEADRMLGKSFEEWRVELAQSSPRLRACLENEKIRVSLASAVQQIENETSKAHHRAFMQLLNDSQKAVEDLKAKGLWKNIDLRDESKLDPRVREALDKNFKDGSAALKAIEERGRNRLLEAGHQILTLGNTDWKP